MMTVLNTTAMTRLWANQVGFNVFGSVYHPLIGLVFRLRSLTSGSYVTNNAGGEVMSIALRYGILKTGQIRKLRSILTHGDDSVVLTFEKLDIEPIFEVIEHDLGIVMSLDKTQTFAPEERTIHFMGS